MMNDILSLAPIILYLVHAICLLTPVIGPVDEIMVLVLLWKRVRSTVILKLRGVVRRKGGLALQGFYAF